MILAKIDITKKERKQHSNEKGLRQQNNHFFRRSSSRDVANHLSSEGSRLCVVEFRKSKNHRTVPFSSAIDPKNLLRIELTWVGEEKGLQIKCSVDNEGKTFTFSITKFIKIH